MSFILDGADRFVGGNRTCAQGYGLCARARAGVTVRKYKIAAAYCSFNDALEIREAVKTLQVVRKQ